MNVIDGKYDDDIKQHVDIKYLTSTIKAISDRLLIMLYRASIFKNVPLRN